MAEGEAMLRRTRGGKIRGVAGAKNG